MTDSLAELHRVGRLSARDLDVAMVAFGAITYDVIRQVIDAREGRKPIESAAHEEDAVAAELVDRICGCQYHDGGWTELVEQDQRAVALAVGGTCVHCPQIRYTMGLLRTAFALRLPTIAVSITGTRLDEHVELPEAHQLTMAAFMRESGITFEDLDELLFSRGQLTDTDLSELARQTCDDAAPPA